ncbi:MAG: DUF2169 family type VI secretion system accessory protein [Nannocystales bacterium]
MWQLDNRTVYAAERIWTRNREGRHMWIVCLKATFNIPRQGRTLELADEQPAPRFEPEYRGEAGDSSIVYEADVVGPKPGTDVLIEGSAHAPSGKPAKEVAVLLRVATIDKLLRVHGERVFVDGGLGIAPSAAAAFTKMPLTYERTFGGADTSSSNPSKHRIDPNNPTGTGFFVDKRSLLGKPAPNVEYMNGDTGRAASFGPVASFWSPRLSHAGTYDAAWIEHRKPLLPADYDVRYLHCAPVDQQISPHLVGGETVQLGNLSPGGSMGFELPRVVPRFRTYFGRRSVASPGRMTGVIIEPDAGQLSLVWNATVEVPPGDIERLDKTVIDEVRG